MALGAVGAKARGWLLAAAVLLLGVPANAGAGGFSLSGRWWTPLGVLKISQQGKQVTGRVSWRCKVCPFKRGQPVFKGTLLEDSLAGRIRYCLKGEKCSGDGWAPLVLLVAREGRVLSGAAHFKPTQCRIGGRGKADGLVMRKLKRRPRPPKRPPKPAAQDQKDQAAKDQAAKDQAAKDQAAKDQAAKDQAAKDQAAKDQAAEDQAAKDQAAKDQAAKDQTAKDQTAKDQTAKDRTAAGDGRAEEPEREDQQAGLGTVADGDQTLEAEVKGPDPKRYAHNAADWQSVMEQGAAHMDNGFFERARRSFRQATKLDPTRPEAYNGIGVTYYARNDYEEALRWYKKALEVEPNFGDAYYNMACIYALQRKANLAFRYLHIAALNGFVQPDVMARDPDLTNLRDDPRYQKILRQMQRR